MKTQLIDMRRQTCITKDNVLIQIDAIVYFQIIEPKKAFFFVDSIQSAVGELSFATFRSVIG